MGTVKQFGRKRKRWSNGKTRLAVAAVLLLSIGAMQAINGEPSDASAALPQRDTVSDCSVTDGDTIRCGGERIRLLGIDAPELPGHCRPGRTCAPGDPIASAQSLAGAMASTITIKRVGTDRYGRTLALVGGPSGDLSCWQLEHAQAIYRRDWDSGFRVERECPAAAFSPL